MDAKTLGVALMSAIVQGMVVGEDGAATLSLSPEKTDRTNRSASANMAPTRGLNSVEARGRSKEAPASHGHMDAAPPTNGRRRPAQSPMSAPPLSAGRRLVLVEGSGGHREEGGPCVRRLRRNASEERQRELGIRLVV